jgi:thioredoxin reductase (NADPH)
VVRPALTLRCLIIGSGPAGYTAAIYAARALLKPVLIAGIQPGGQLTITTDVENYPGFADVIQGPWLMEQMEAQAEHVGTEIVSDIVLSMDLSSARSADLRQRPGLARRDRDHRHRRPGQVAGPAVGDKFQGFGVSACATCDGFFYRNKEVVVVGGGNTAVEEALFLTSFASKVTLVHRRTISAPNASCRSACWPIRRSR